MISVVELLYEIDFKLNKLSTLQHQSIPEENKLIALNNAQIKFILLRLGPNNKHQLGLDAFKKRYQDLEVLIEPPHEHPVKVELVDKKLNKWDVALSTLEQFMFYIDAYALATKGNCRDIVIYVNNDLIKHADVTLLLNNSHYRPSFEYQETFNTLSKDRLELYTDGSFDFTKVYVSYLRYPKLIDVAGYIKLTGKESVNQDCELPDYLKDTLVTMAVEELAISTENVPAIQSSDRRQISLE